MEYVFCDEIAAFHGKEWMGKFDRMFGIGTAPAIGDNSRAAVFYEDYLRFANKIDYGTPTFWD